MPASSWAIIATTTILMSQTLRAAPAPLLPRLLRDLEYSPRLRFDASLPATSAPAPVAILVHGGGWVRGDRRTNVEPLFEPLTNAGFAWFSISYTLATNPLEVGSAVTDVEAAILHIRAHAAEYHIDPDRIVLIGESAGGQLAAMAALGRTAGDGVKAVVALYTPTDLAALARTSDLIPAVIREQLKGTPWAGLILARLEQLSPLARIHKDMPPFLFIHGDADPLVPLAQSRLMCDRMQALDVACQLITVPGGGHGMRAWESSPAYKQEMVQWLQQQLGVSVQIPAQP